MNCLPKILMPNSFDWDDNHDYCLYNNELYSNSLCYFLETYEIFTPIEDEV